ncbi:MAG: DUF3108 domain-containing protein [Saprospiraceae bacterium]|nr:DUF3108 domain-containing protein [Saprospiraceae bacterium]
MRNKILRWMCFPIVCLFFSFADSNVHTNTVQIEPCYIENTTFKGGETITYKVYYNWNFIWLSAGEVTFNINDLGNQYKMTAVGKTYKSYEWFFKLDDKYVSNIDKNSMLPTVFERNVNEGKVKFYEKIVFDQGNRSATTYYGENENSTKTLVKKMDGCMHDMMSILYFTRNIDYKKMTVNSEVPIKIFLDKETWPLKIKYKGEVNNIKLHGTDAKYNALKFMPQVVAGNVFKENTAMSVYVSNDGNKIPILIESPVSVGSIKAVLKNYSGLRHNFDSKMQ